jgi:hypothetical protein
MLEVTMAGIVTSIENFEGFAVAEGIWSVRHCFPSADHWT